MSCVMITQQNISIYIYIYLKMSATAYIYWIWKWIPANKTYFHDKEALTRNNLAENWHLERKKNPNLQLDPRRNINLLVVEAHSDEKQKATISHRDFMHTRWKNLVTCSIYNCQALASIKRKSHLVALLPAAANTLSSPMTCLAWAPLTPSGGFE